MKRAVVILLLILGGVTSATANDNTGVISDSAGADPCAPPIILNPPDTLYGDSLNFVEYQFLADPGGINGNGEIHWEMVWPTGEIDSTSGCFTFGPVQQADTWPAMIRVVSESLADTCFFLIVTTKGQIKSRMYRTSMLSNPAMKNLYVFGPEGAESLAVSLDTYGSSRGLNDMGIEYRVKPRNGHFLAKVSIDQYIQLKKVPPAIFLKPEPLRFVNSCLRPRVQNPPDTLYGDSHNSGSYQFLADPGGVDQTAYIHWELVSPFGEIDSASGHYSFESVSQALEFPAQIRVVNDCAEPFNADTCTFQIVTTIEEFNSTTTASTLFRDPFIKETYVFGCEGAESVGVSLGTDVPIGDLDNLDIDYRLRLRDSTLSARVSVDQYIQLKKLRPAVDVTLLHRRVAASCAPPVILNPPDTLYGDSLNFVEYQFLADPGGINGNGDIHWEVVWPMGGIDSATGLFTYGPTLPAGTWPGWICVVNDCMIPPNADSCFFQMVMTVDKFSSRGIGTGLLSNPLRKRMYVFGPEGAESVAVWIETDGTTDELDETGIKYRPSFRKNIYMGRMSVDEYVRLKQLKSIIRVTPMNLHDEALSILSSAQCSPRLDISKSYFFADSARTLYDVDGSGADSCAPPVILNPPDTLYGDSLNVVEYEFLADPGGINGNGEIHWEMVWGYGEIDSLSGLFSAGPFPHVWMYPASICVVNDCASPPNADTCLFEMVTTVDKHSSRKPGDNLPAFPAERRMYVFGPEDAESVAVWIETDGTEHELKELGIKYRRVSAKSIYGAAVSIDEYIKLKNLKSVIRVTPQSLIWDANSASGDPITFSPTLDISSSYFFADSARTLYDVDGSGVIVAVIDKDNNPLLLRLLAIIM